MRCPFTNIVVYIQKIIDILIVNLMPILGKLSYSFDSYYFAILGDELHVKQTFKELND